MDAPRSSVELLTRHTSDRWARGASCAVAPPPPGWTYAAMVAGVVTGVDCLEAALGPGPSAASLLLAFLGEALEATGGRSIRPAGEA
eukprot:scaffold315651_cov23-Prasinocladus_malaysianus.AAC.1